MSRSERAESLRTLEIVARERGSIVVISAQPGARREGVLGVRAGAVRIAVNAPPEKGKANAAIQAVLAEALGCKAAAIELVSGASARQKRFFIHGISPGELRERLASLLAESMED